MDCDGAETVCDVAETGYGGTMAALKQMVATASRQMPGSKCEPYLKAAGA